MLLTPGTRLGPYEIVASLGAGGMGEVYRARDTRLGREVAIKTLPPVFAADRERRARFEAEARAVAALSHPNVLAIHDVGAEGELSYAVTELVEGVTLRERLADGPLPASRAIPIAIQLAHGLAAAHDRGVVHRDLKPENVIVTPDGRAKILDFGLARMEAPAGADSQSLAPTVAASTEPGMVLGTVGYMAPEQVRGQTADARSDLFALGAVLYEMLGGRRAFAGDSQADTLSAILREDPPDLATRVPDLPPALDRTVRRCLEKLPVNRFRSAADLAFALEALSTLGSGSVPAVAGRGTPAFHRLTYRNGNVAGARFTPDGAGVVYGASWDGAPHEIFTSRVGSPESRGLGLPPGSLLAMSSTGEMAISTGYHHRHWFEVSGTLARVPLAGGGVRPLQKDVGHADWSPDGRALAVIRYADGRCRLEYPPGKSLVEVQGWLGSCRVSPDGKRVAFGRFGRSGEGEGDLCVADGDSNVTVLARAVTNLNGIAWSPAGEEVWWTDIDATQRHGLWATRLDGATRRVYASPVRLTLHDIHKDGRVLLTFDELRCCVSVGTAEGPHAEELSWFDGSAAADLTADGGQLLFVEVAEAENPHYGCYVRALDGSPAVRLGTGNVSRFSSDGQWVVTITNHPRHELWVYPVGFGEPHMVPCEGIESLHWATFHPDGRHLFVVGSAPDRPSRLYRVPVEGGTPQLLWDEEIAFDRFTGLPISPEGERVVLPRKSGGYSVLRWEDGTVTPLRGLGPGRIPMRYDDTGRSLWVFAPAAEGRAVERLDLDTGTCHPWRTIAPPDRLGVLFVAPPVVAANGSRYTVSYLRVVSNLYVAEGLE